MCVFRTFKTRINAHICPHREGTYAPFRLPRTYHHNKPFPSEFTMDDIEAFFAEQEQRMNLPDEDVDEYIRARLEDYQKNKYARHSIGSLLPAL